jgi:hypothetical protein
MTRSAYREAAVCFDHALAALQQLPQTPETLAQAIDLRLDLRQALHPLGEMKRGFGYLRDAEHLAKILNDPRRLGWVSVLLCHYYWLRREFTEAGIRGRTALAIGEAQGDFRLTVAATLYLGLVRDWR